MEAGSKSRWPVVVAALVVAVLVVIGWQMKSRSADRAAAAAKPPGEGERAVDWEKVGKDAARMEERSRHQAEIEKARLLATQDAREQGYDYRRRNEDNVALGDQVGAPHSLIHR